MVDFSNLLARVEHHPAAIALLSTIIAAFAALMSAWSAWASAKSAKEAERGRVQTAEPYLRLSAPRPFFTIAWRPQLGKPPAVFDGWIAGYGNPSWQPIELAISNYGGGPALDLRITVKVANGEQIVPDFTTPDTGAVTVPLAWSLGVLESATDAVRILNEQTEFVPACGSGEPVPIKLEGALLLRLFPTTVQLEQDGYYPSGTPASEGRVRWDVSVQYRTALRQSAEFTAAIYAERVRVETLGEDSARWFEKLYRCEVQVEPTDDFETTPYPVDAHAQGALDTVKVRGLAASATGDR
jgi:hypothetical protein